MMIPPTGIPVAALAPRRRHRFAAAAFCALILPVWVGVPGEAAEAPPAGWRQAVVLQQEDVTCGAAALATMLRLSGRTPAPQPAIVDAMLEGRTLDDIRHQGGFSLLDLQRYLASLGIASYGESGLGLDAVLARVPAITPLAIGGGRYHYVVVVGAMADRIAVANPASGPQWLSRRSFLEAWDGVVFKIGKPDIPDN